MLYLWRETMGVKRNLTAPCKEPEMLTNNDYRAAMLQAYRAYRRPVSLGAHLRAPGMAPRTAFRLARATVKPLPEALESRTVRDAMRAYPEFSQYREALGHTARQCWKATYSLTRFNARGC